MLQSFLITLQAWRQETGTKVFSCEYCDSFKSRFFHKTLPVDTEHFWFRRREVLYEKKFLKISKASQESTYVRVSFRTCNFIKKETPYRCFPENFQEHLFSRSTPGGCLYRLPKKESTGEFTKNFLWNQISLICDNRFSRLFKSFAICDI